MALDAASYPVLWQIYDQTGIRPEYLLPSLWVESGLNPAIQNLSGAPYYGINQASGTWLQGQGIDPQQYLTWPASQQLSQVVLKYALGWPKPLLSGTRVEQANFLGATINGTAGWTAARSPNDVVVSDSDLAPGQPNANTADYQGNKGIDTAHKGYITVADLSAFVGKAVPNLQSVLQQTYALRPSEVMQDPVLGTDPYLRGGPVPPPVPGRPVVSTNVALAVGGSIAILGTAGLVAWGLSRRPASHLLARENPVRRCPTGSQVQALLFSRFDYTPSEAKRWAKSHGYKYGDVDVGPAWIHLRQRDPRGFRRIRTVWFGRGIKARVGWRSC
jgi:hypothetical protein